MNTVIIVGKYFLSLFIFIFFTSAVFAKSPLGSIFLLLAFLMVVPIQSWSNWFNEKLKSPVYKWILVIILFISGFLLMLSGRF